MGGKVHHTVRSSMIAVDTQLDCRSSNSKKRVQRIVRPACSTSKINSLPGLSSADYSRGSTISGTRPTSANSTTSVCNNNNWSLLKTSSSKIMIKRAMHPHLIMKRHQLKPTTTRKSRKRARVAVLRRLVKTRSKKRDSMSRYGRDCSGD